MSNTKDLAIRGAVFQFLEKGHPIAARKMKSKLDLDDADNMTDDQLDVATRQQSAIKSAFGPKATFSTVITSEFGGSSSSKAPSKSPALRAVSKTASPALKPAAKKARSQSPAPKTTRRQRSPSSSDSDDVPPVITHKKPPQSAAKKPVAVANNNNNNDDSSDDDDVPMKFTSSTNNNKNINHGSSNSAAVASSAYDENNNNSNYGGKRNNLEGVHGNLNTAGQFSTKPGGKERFCRIDLDKVEFKDDRLKDNRPDQSASGFLQNQKMMAVRGKEFNKHKQKNKSKLYAAGVDQSIRSIKFGDDSE